MLKAYMGIDIGSISTKGVIIDSNNNILVSEYLYTEGNPIDAVKRLVSSLRDKFDSDKYKIVSVGTTGSARKLIGVMMDASVVKNEVIAHSVGAKNVIPDVKTVLDFGGQDFKIIKLNNGIVVDYEINDFEVEIDDNVEFLLKNEKKIIPPIVFQGGVSRDKGVIKTFEEGLGEKIYVDSNSHLMGALGVAILAHNSNIEKEFDFNILDIKIDNDVSEGVKVFRGDEIIYSWGNKCVNGEIKVGS